MQLFIYFSCNITDRPYKIKMLEVKSFLFLKKNLIYQKKLNKIIIYVLLSM